MKKFKRILALLVLVAGAALCFCSCSCSKKPVDPVPPDTGGGGGSSGNLLPGTFSVSVSINGTGGTYLSSTGNDVHAENSSPVYTFTPDVGFAVETITLDGATYFTHQASGYDQEAKTVAFENIASDHVLVVTFHQLEFFVDCDIQEDKYSSIDGGSVLNTDSSFYHKGGTSPVYTISPNAGYCVYFLRVDGESVFEYADDPQKAVGDIVLTEPFKKLVADHSIEVAFYELMELDGALLENYYTTQNEFLPELIEDSDIGVVSHEIEGGTGPVPSGMPQKVNLDVHSSFDFVGFEISLDGETYSARISATEDFFGTGFSFDASELAIYIDEFDANVHIKTYSEPKTVTLIVYNYNTNETFSIENVSQYSYYVIDEMLKDSYWYYSLSSNYTEKSVYKTASVTSTEVANDDIYHIYLQGKMLCVENNSIILIYSTTDLKK